MADQGFSVAVYNRTIEKTQVFIKNEVGGRDIRAGYALSEFVGLLQKPRAIVMLVKAEGHVLIYIHKEQMLNDVEQR